MEAPGDKRVWFAMSAPYRNEMKAKEKLDDIGVEYFVPMRYVVTERGGVKRRSYVPVVRNLIFVREEEAKMTALKTYVPALQYKMYKNGDGMMCKAVVRDEEMASFIKVCKEKAEGLTFYTPDEVDLKKGQHIRILGGPLDGAEGYFVKVKGSRSKKFVVSVSGFITVAASVSVDLIEVIKD